MTSIPTRVTPRRARSLAAVIALGCVAVAVPARAQLSAPSLSNASSADENDNGANNSWDRQSAVVQLSSSGSSFAVRYKATVSSDSGAFGANKTESLVSDYTITFTVTAPGAYYVDVATQLLGQLDVVYDGGLTGGSADISAVTGSQTGGTAILSGSLGLADPGSCTIGGSSATSCHLPFNQTGSARVFGVSNGSPVTHTLRFQFTSSAFSAAASGHEAAMRLGIQSRDCSNGASQYPGDNNRDVNADGHFVTVTFTSLCGNGAVDAPAGSSYAESCDQGARERHVTARAARRRARSRRRYDLSHAAGAVRRRRDLHRRERRLPDRRLRDRRRLPAGGGRVRPRRDLHGRERELSRRRQGDQRHRLRRRRPAVHDATPATARASTCQHAIGNAGAVCRPAAGGCDVEETCSGASASCPADVLAGGGSECRAAAGPCDVAESCTGSSAACPADALGVERERVPPGGRRVRRRGELHRQRRRVSGGHVRVERGHVSRVGRRLRSRRALHRARRRVSVRRARAADAGLPRVGRRLRSQGGLRRRLAGLSRRRQEHHECRPSAGVCDPSESCNGVGNDCPADVLSPSTTVLPRRQPINATRPRPAPGERSDVSRRRHAARRHRAATTATSAPSPTVRRRRLRRQLEPSAATA